ncbi:MAG: hypothetical protein Q9N02_04280 [Ghiorsea sp.]|nr:hypothetical protein [Ghiorsea sp.]
MNHVRPKRKTLKITIATAAPLRILLFSLPLWGGSLLLIFMMPLTGIVSSFVIAGCVFILPFKAKKGECPACGKLKLFPFSGFGSQCKGCGEDIVLRGEDIHLLEPKSNTPIAGSGRGNQPTRR